MEMKRGFLTGLAIMALAIPTATMAQQAQAEKKPSERGAAARQAGPSNGKAPAKVATRRPEAKAAAKPKDKVVLRVGSEAATKGDLDFAISSMNQQLQQSVATQGRRPVGEQYALMLVLSRKAVEDHLDSQALIRRELALHRLQSLAQAEYEKMATDTPVTRQEVAKYYTDHTGDFDEAVVREAVVRKKPDGATGPAPGLPIAEAKVRMEAIRKALTDGTDSQKIADQFRAGNEVMIDAEPRTVRRGQLIAGLDQAAFVLKEGAVSDAIDTPQAIVALQVVSRRKPELNDVAGEIENMIRQQKLEVELGALRGQSPVWMDDDYFKPPATPSPPANPPATKP